MLPIHWDFSSAYWQRPAAQMIALEKGKGIEHFKITVRQVLLLKKKGFYSPYWTFCRAPLLDDSFTSTPALGGCTQLVPKSHREELWRTGRERLQPWGSCTSLHLTLRHAGVPHHVTWYKHKSVNLYSPSLNLSCICPWTSKNGFPIMNAYTQNTGETVHMRKNASAMGEAKSPFHQRLLQLLCTSSKAIERWSSYLKWPSSPYMARHNAMLSCQLKSCRISSAANMTLGVSWGRAAREQHGAAVPLPAPSARGCPKGQWLGKADFMNIEFSSMKCKIFSTAVNNKRRQRWRKTI